MSPRCVIETRLATHFEMYIASDDGDTSDDLVGLLCVLFYWHVVRQLSHAFFGEKSRDQNICFRQIQLTHAHVRQQWPNLETSSLLVIKHGSKDCRGVEIRVAEEIDRAVHPD